LNLLDTKDVQLPDTLKMPKSLQQRRVEVILLPLDAEKGSVLIQIRPSRRFPALPGPGLVIRWREKTREHTKSARNLIDLSAG
jgi:hypothetical protein